MEKKIGQIIRNVLDNSEHTISWFAKKLNTTRSNVYNIFERDSIDTTLLLTISKILNHNFFNYYSSLLQASGMKQIASEGTTPYFTKYETEIKLLTHDKEILLKRNAELTSELLGCQKNLLDCLQKKKP
jgi:hypothetical protein